MVEGAGGAVGCGCGVDVAAVVVGWVAAGG